MKDSRLILFKFSESRISNPILEFKLANKKIGLEDVIQGCFYSCSFLFSRFANKIVVICLLS